MIPAPIYLACPYFSPDPYLRLHRFNLANAVAARLMQAGHVVFSPITHGHHLAPHLPEQLAHSHDFWMGQCLPMLSICSALYILPLPGWDKSKGVAEEIKRAKFLSIPITHLSLKDFPPSP